MFIERHFIPGDTLLVRASMASRDAWDAFAQTCGKSFRCAHRASRVWQFEAQPLHRLHRLEIFAPTEAGEVKVGQCAVGLGPSGAVFGDSLQILPGRDDLWLPALQAVMRRLGPGRYRYGSDWNLEKSRELELSGCANVSITNVQNFCIQYVDFQNWPSTDEYLSNVSKNIRWNLKKAQRSYPSFDISQLRGLHLRRIVRACLLRLQIYKRKGIKSSKIEVFLRSLARSIAVPQYTNYAQFRFGRRVFATCCNIEFGADTYCLEAASVRNNRGAAWRLMMDMISHAWRRSEGRGRFVLGSDDFSQKDDPVWRGLVWSRQQCRVSSMPSSVIDFVYHGEFKSNTAAS